MNKFSHKANWQIPAGVSEGNWQYIHSDLIARGYDQSLEDSPLVSIDQSVILRHLPEQPGTLIDFGCGTGRNGIPILEKGWNVVGVDLSSAMLKQFWQKTPQPPDSTRDRLLLLKANLVELDVISDDSADFGMCLFSTLGMIRGKEHRQAFLRSAKRILKPGATFVVHGHNYWASLRQPGGAGWMLRNFVSSLAGQAEVGDRTADYRDVKDLMLHHFSLRSLCSELREAGFEIGSRYAILPDRVSSKVGLGTTFSAIGWMVAAS